MTDDADADVTSLRMGLLHQYQLTTSGSGIYLQRLAEHLMSRGHAVSLMSHDPPPAFSTKRSPARTTTQGRGTCRIHSLRGAGTPVAYPRAEEPGSALFGDLSHQALTRYLGFHVDRVTRIVERERLTVLHANSEVPMSHVARLVSQRTGVPYVTVAHGSTLEYLCRGDIRYRTLCRAGLVGASATVALNADVRARVLNVAPEIADRLEVVPPGVDCSVFHPHAGARDRPALAYVGRLSVDKGVFLLAGSLPEIAAQVPGVRLIVVGDGPDRRVLELMTSALSRSDVAGAERILREVVQPEDEPWVSALVRSWSGRAITPLDVTFTGHLPPEGVAAQMAVADVVVVPSLVREAFPLVVLEALASGTPPLAVDAGGLGAVLAELSPRLGVLGPLLSLPARREALVREMPRRAATLLAHLSQPAHREAARSSCRALAVEAYSWHRVGARLEDIYRAAIKAVPLARQSATVAAV